MGMYTEFHFNSELRDNVPEDVIAILQYMLGEVEERPPRPDHVLFQEGRWKFMLQSDSYYFDADTHSSLRFDEISKSYYLCIRCNLKNYHNEIENFIHWITPYLERENGEFLGFYRYEETEVPTLISVELT